MFVCMVREVFYSETCRGFGGKLLLACRKQCQYHQTVGVVTLKFWVGAISCSRIGQKGRGAKPGLVRDLWHGSSLSLETGNKKARKVQVAIGGMKRH